MIRNKHLLRFKLFTKAPDKILIITLGCSKNIVDSEKLMRQLSANSLKIEYDKTNSNARTVIINTCGFINDAKQESIDTILHYINARKNNEIDRLYVIGCLSQRYANELRKELPEVDKYFGVNSLKEIIESLNYKYSKELLNERYLSTPSHYAYLKISEGCNRKCSFCSIPFIRGSYNSSPVEELIAESKILAKNGVKELIIIAQDISYYGIDLYKTHKLTYLLNKLADIEGIEWLRLQYAYPLGITKELIETIGNNPKICKYLDIPLQHISDNMLKLMRRGINKNNIVRLINKIREKVPGIFLRTTMLVGHPGETEKDFNELLEFVNNYRFERLGIFTYSNEENTYSAKNYSDSIPNKTKIQRANKIMAVQQSISFETNQKFIGNCKKIIIDSKESDFYIGRTEFDSPEVDNEVLIKSDRILKKGNFYNVQITGANEFDLRGIV